MRSNDVKQKKFVTDAVRFVALQEEGYGGWRGRLRRQSNAMPKTVALRSPLGRSLDRRGKEFGEILVRRKNVERQPILREVNQGDM